MQVELDPSKGGTRGRGQSGSAIVVSLALLLLLVILGTALLSLSSVESNISHNDMWAEGAFHAAEAGAHVAINQLDPDPAVSSVAIAETLLVGDFRYRSGNRLAAAPQPLVYLGVHREPGFGLGLGTGYNPSGYAFARYRINATGLGPRNTRREVEIAADYGPVAE